MNKLFNAWAKLLLCEIRKFLGKRFRGSRTTFSVISNSKINYNINPLLNRYGKEMKACELDKEKTYR
jgi:hypothetical protein